MNWTRLIETQRLELPIPSLQNEAPTFGRHSYQFCFPHTMASQNVLMSMGGHNSELLRRIISYIASRINLLLSGVESDNALAVGKLYYAFSAYMYQIQNEESEGFFKPSTETSGLVHRRQCRSK